MTKLRVPSELTLLAKRIISAAHDGVKILLSA